MCLAKPVISQVKALRLTRDDFEVLKIIGRGSFGEVAVVRLKNTDQVSYFIVELILY
jgi:serine/threonine-protein kinase MRCK